MGREVSGQAVTYTEEIHVNTPERYEILCITDDVQRIIRESGVIDGLVLVNPMPHHGLRLRQDFRIRFTCRHHGLVGKECTCVRCRWEEWSGIPTSSHR
ncbi:MAG: hypothetical protein Ct9H90mP16_04840 [Candidatus Poseidoniales archaeon]|nr:MAG: hypothetical protein Ct9H90mP16_04840 [Candidatus Poseidoniales archaeon]